MKSIYNIKFSALQFQRKYILLYILFLINYRKKFKLLLCYTYKEIVSNLSNNLILITN